MVVHHSTATRSPSTIGSPKRTRAASWAEVAASQ